MQCQGLTALLRLTKGISQTSSGFTKGIPQTSLGCRVHSCIPSPSLKCAEELDSAPLSLGLLQYNQSVWLQAQLAGLPYVRLYASL